MNHEDKIYSFAFKGLLTTTSLDNTGLLSYSYLSPSIDEEIAERLSLELLDDDLVKKARSMATVYIAIAAFENSVRSFIKKILLESLGENWWSKGATAPVIKKVDTRMEDESKTRWHTPRGQDGIYYTDLSDLIPIIRKNWPLFEAYIVSIEWAKNIFDTLELSRNVIMHSGELEKTDIERIGTSMRDWIRQVGI